MNAEASSAHLPALYKGQCSCRWDHLLRRNRNRSRTSVFHLRRRPYSQMKNVRVSPLPATTIYSREESMLLIYTSLGLFSPTFSKSRIILNLGITVCSQESPKSLWSYHHSFRFYSEASGLVTSIQLTNLFKSSGRRLQEELPAS